MNSLISIVIPVKNGIKTLGSCLDGIFKQTLKERIEVIIIDSGSTDGTLEMLQDYSVKIFKIKPSEFNHGATRNYGVALAKGKFVVMTVQDAKPVDTKWLETMLIHFKDPKVVGVCGQQVVPHEKDKNPHAWFRPQSEPRVRRVTLKNSVDFDFLNSIEKKELCNWDNVNAMYRKEFLLDSVQFETIPFGEDNYWAMNTLLKGFDLIHDHRSRVYHYHHAHPKYIRQRIMMECLFHYKLFHYLEKPRWKIIDFIKVIYRNFRFGCSLKWVYYNWRLLFLTKKAKWDFWRIVKNDELHKIEDEIVLNLPQGRV